MSYYFKLLKKYKEAGGETTDSTPQFRLKSRVSTPNNTDGLAMRIADPLWMLGRQWQFGEFIGEDNGSPIGVKVHCRKEAVTECTVGSQKSSLLEQPLEKVVEELYPKQFDLKSKVRIGQQFERLIEEHHPNTASEWITKLRKDFPLTFRKWDGYALKTPAGMDEKSLRFFQLMEGKVIDGTSLLKGIRTADYPDSIRGVDYAPLKTVTRRFKKRYEDLLAILAEDKNKVDAWNPKTLAHQFTVDSEQVSLHAPDYQSGHLDWYTFDNATVRDYSKIEKPETEFQQPVNVSFASLPDKRLFSFEDNQIDLSMMDVKAGDLLKLMLLDFSFVSGSDWYTIPMEMQLGEIGWIESIVVKDVFGICTEIENDKERGAKLANGNGLGVWDVFKIRNDNPQKYLAEKHFLFMAPAAMHRLESEPIEELLFLRDEYANMIWAVEQKIPNAMGNPTDGFDLHLELYGPFQQPDDDENKSDIPAFRFANTVPSNWIPYLPNHLSDSNKEIELCRAYMLRNESEDTPSDIKPLTFLAGEDLIKTREESIPKAGVRVQLTRQRIRWTDGSTHVWMGRKVKAGRGEGNSGLRFDFLNT